MKRVDGMSEAVECDMNRKDDGNAISRTKIYSQQLQTYLFFLGSCRCSCGPPSKETANVGRHIVQLMNTSPNAIEKQAKQQKPMC